jgi:hypothetical protein
LVLLAACCNYWGRAYRSEPPGLLREARVEGPRESGEAPTAEDELSSIYIL